MTPRFSIIIPCYNQGPFLQECLESVAAQTLRPHEVIVIDDGSTDPYTVTRIDQLCAGGVTLVRQANRGLSGARNAGADASTGDWILPLDADDQLTPDALAAYAEAIERDPAADIWYPDMELFGQMAQVADMDEFDPWRQLWANSLVYSSAIRRRVFESGVRYDERLRSYEDWAFWVHACCERGFRPKRLQKPVFRYRRWGYTMISAADDRRDRFIADIRRCRPIYSDARRLDQLKRASSPYFAIAAGSDRLAASLERQSFRDARLVETTGAVLRDGALAAFQSAPGTHLMLSLDDDSFVRALDRDPCLLEKLALRLLARETGLTFVEHGERMALVAPFALFLERPPIGASDAGLLADLERHATALGAPIHTIDLAPESVTAAGRERSPARVLSVARDLGRRALERALAVTSRPAPVEPPPPPGEGPVRVGPVPQLTIPLVLRLRMIATDEPRFGTTPGPAVLLAIPRAGGRDTWVAAVAKACKARVLLLSESPAYTPDAFSLPEIDGAEPAQVVAELVQRHDVRAVMLADAPELYEFLPALARLERRPRVIVRLEAAGPDSLGERMAVRYNNLIDAYLVSPRQAHQIDGLCTRCYVSPAKVRAVADDALAAELERFTA